MRRAAGFFIFLLGIGMAAWIGYNLLINRLPDTQNINPIPGILVTLGFLYVGFKWMKGQQAD